MPRIDLLHIVYEGRPHVKPLQYRVIAAYASACACSVPGAPEAGGRMQGTVSLLSRACALALAGVMAWGGGASAQERGIVETVIVTAERRSQDLQTSAISATVLNAVELENKSVYGLTALQFAAPGLYIADYSSANTFNIRGIGQSTVNFEYP